MRLTSLCLRSSFNTVVSKDFYDRFVPRTEAPCTKPKHGHWHPGHMSKGLKRMQMMARIADCILEIHDARIPYTSRNTIANSSYGDKPRILLLNKADLVDRHQLNVICKQISVKESIPVFPTKITVNRKSELRNIIKDAVSMANAEQLTILKPHYTMFVSGLPNVGKSSFVNVFGKDQDSDKNKLRVAPNPGVTRNIEEKMLIMRSPKVYVYDTPGVSVPKLADHEAEMKLAVCGCVPAHITGHVQTADYLLYWLNRKHCFDYCQKCGLAGPSNNVIEVLVYYARKRNFMVDGKPSIIDAAHNFINMFNKGELGKIILEDAFLLRDKI